jgi:hypothetical protein
MATQTQLSLAKIAELLDEAGVPWAVLAGAAACVYGATRPLTDIDILTPRAEGERLAALFPEAPVVRQDDGSVRGIHLPGFDIIAGMTMREADGDYTVDLDEEMRARLQHHEIAGVSVPVIPPEDNMLLKAMWGRGAEVGKHDWEDVQAMMDHLPEIDWAYLHWRARDCGTGALALQALERLKALQSEQR